LALGLPLSTINGYLYITNPLCLAISFASFMPCASPVSLVLVLLYSFLCPCFLFLSSIDSGLHTQPITSANTEHLKTKLIMFLLRIHWSKEKAKENKDEQEVG
jgi:hypothetical protein